jgi:septal ring factor EnvC (AmiA/AmiB activator)
MVYLLSQIWLCLLITALLAGLLGWLLRGGGKKKLNMLNEKWQDKYDALSQERNSYASKINKLSGVTHEKDRLENKIETQKHTYEQKLTRLTKQLTMVDEETQKQQSLLAQKDEELAMSMAHLASKISEY